MDSQRNIYIAPLSYGLLYLLAAALPSAYLITATTKRSILRICWLPCLVLISHQMLLTFSDFTTSTVCNGLLKGEALLVMVQCGNLLLIQALDSTDLQRTVYKQSDSSTTKTMRTLCLVFNLRGVNTPWQVKSVGTFPRFYASDSNDGRIARHWYVVRQLLIIAWQYLFLDIIQTSELQSTPEMNEKLFSKGSEYMYPATPEQWAARISVGLIAWIGPARVNLDLWYRCLGLIFVTIGISNPEDWPPLFGNMLEAYTLRGWWSRLWHQFCRWPLSSFSNFVARDVLRLARPSLLERYLNIFLVFLGSGAVHAALEFYAIVPPSLARAFTFFTSFALGIMIEDGAQELWRRLRGTPSNSASNHTPLWHKLIGFTWVAIWMMVVSPPYLYPVSRLPSAVRWQVPFSIAESTGMPLAQTVLVAGGLAVKFMLGGEI